MRVDELELIKRKEMENTSLNAMTVPTMAITCDGGDQTTQVRLVSGRKGPECRILPMTKVN